MNKKLYIAIILLAFVLGGVFTMIIYDVFENDDNFRLGYGYGYHYGYKNGQKSMQKIIEK